ncbi:hypothetical protein F5B22DRAFT_647887 [Xylaria bambusicola]|uniref:uncharacterized protein n=1 Tax=Xylaria bambusicola TaxID=326684 RepID=UPI002008A02B|nr:uncharacterized protein F5B22DRAFT_647887 [Xylaria bambusicola]KAI0513336.1 hypothetical protein F5B22DRAFT_647887 [Xylaria bambusicola]
MQLQSLYIFALAGLGAATTTCLPSDQFPTKTSICADYSSACGSPPTATVWYGGCYDITETPTFTVPPCPTGASSMDECTSTGTVCDTLYRTCVTPIPTTLTYGACHDACVNVTYSAPGCPTATPSITVVDPSSCTNTYTLCEDHIKECGSPTPTAYLTYGGCHPACETPTYSPPPCPTASSYAAAFTA